MDSDPDVVKFSLSGSGQKKGLICSIALCDMNVYHLYFLSIHIVLVGPSVLGIFVHGKIKLVWCGERAVETTAAYWRTETLQVQL